MIKKVLKYSLFTYLAIPVISLLFMTIRYGFHADLTDFLEGLLVVLLVEAGFFFTGLILGLFITAIARKPRLEWCFYLIGQVAAFLALSFYITTGVIEDRKGRKPAISSYDPTTPGRADSASLPYVQLAFDNLQKRFKPSDKFHLKIFDAYRNDTLNPTRRDTTFTVYLIYTLDSAKGREFYSKYLMGRNDARLLIFNKAIESPTPDNIR